MASRVSKSLLPVSRPWVIAVSGVSKSVGEFCRPVRSRSYSDNSVDGAHLEKPAVASNPVADSSPASQLPVASVTPVTPPKTGPYPPRNIIAPRGVYKAILLGEVGQLPVQKMLKSGKSVTIFSVGTGGMYNNRRPFEGESPEEYADRSYTQWHRVAVYQDRVASMVMQNMKIGSQVYLEGNIESRVYNDPNSGIVKRIREVAIRANGRLMFMEAPMAHPKGETAKKTSEKSSTEQVQSSTGQAQPSVPAS